MTNPGQTGAGCCLVYATHDPVGVELALQAMRREVGVEWCQVSRREAVELDSWAARVDDEVPPAATLDDVLALSEAASAELVERYAPGSALRRLGQVARNLDVAKQALSRLQREQSLLIRQEAARGVPLEELAAAAGLTPKVVGRIVAGDRPGSPGRAPVRMLTS